MIFVPVGDGPRSGRSQGLRSWAIPFEFLSDEQIARYGRFPEEPSAAELEQFFRLDRSASDALASKQRPATKLGWAVQWGTARMLEVFLTDAPLAVPPDAVGFVAEQLDLDPAHFADYGQQQTVYEHAWEIRKLLDIATSARVRARCVSTWRPGCGPRQRGRGVDRPDHLRRPGRPGDRDGLSWPESLAFLPRP
ncbi:DUF4158 domain-containing protein [Microtetraspora malaysiensis]|uniref:DUF4158 domain-containing protein n=1 Tax=Microtetraspora malaysiensis TaxID=161358 RepID=UPI003D92DE9E